MITASADESYVAALRHTKPGGVEERPALGFDEETALFCSDSEESDFEGFDV